MYDGVGDNLILVRLKDFAARDTTRNDLEMLYQRQNLPFGGYRQRDPDSYPGKQVGEIGAMKAVGATSGRILRIYLVAGLMYGLVGSVIGLAAGVAGSFG